MDKQQIVALVAAVAMLVAVLLDATFTYGELPDEAAAAQAHGPDGKAQPAPVAPQRVVAKAEAG